MKYRIVEYVAGIYTVERRRAFWPFWSNPGLGLGRLPRLTVDSAKAEIAELKRLPRVVHSE